MQQSQQQPQRCPSISGSVGSGPGGGGVGVNAQPLVPTISVTPHSPAAKHYPVLEDTLRQLHEIHDTIQQMRDQSVQALNPDVLRLAACSRMSASCPSLNEAFGDIDLNHQGSLGSSPSHHTASRKGSAEWMLYHGLEADTVRRRSWTALEDLTGKDKKHERTRRCSSMSLSSMESEADESSIIDVADGTTRLLGTHHHHQSRTRGVRVSAGGASTHSLNEADLQADCNKLKARREAEALRLIPTRLPLQKSVSTPSIIAVRDLAVDIPPILAGAQPTLPVCRPSGTESETEEEGIITSGHHHHTSEDHIHNTETFLHDFLQNTAYDHHSEKSRRKRGSLFFRKKKDKNKKAIHQWVSASYATTNICDWCTTPLANKPSLYCENCNTTVHQNNCKDNFIECHKPKNSKNVSKTSAFGVQITNSKSSSNKRNSGSSQGQNSSNSQIINEEKEADHSHPIPHHDSTNFPDDVPLVALEFLSDSPVTSVDLGADPALGLHDTEPDSWTPYVGKDIAKKLKEKEVKRQEHIYEFILTEKHHCLTLLVMQKIFVEGLQKYFQLGPNLERMFPRLLDLTELHLQLLHKLRQRQREDAIVSSIADILLEQFSQMNAVKLKSAYGEFCSRHRDAVDIYKYYLQHDVRFGQFVRHCQSNPLLKKKGIPECILFVTQRLTKYPLLIEPLIKTSKENKIEQEKLQKALTLVKEILVEVDAQVAEKEKEDRKLEIYNRIDAKSYTTHRGTKFKKSDILQGNRALRFEGFAMLMQGRGKMQAVMVIVLSDVLFFLQENSHKYSFFTPENKAGVVSLQKLLVREKAGQESRSIYLISSNPADPEMFELKVHKPKDKQIWIQAIRSAVKNCPEDEEDTTTLSVEEKQKILNAKQSQIRQLVGLLRQKDVEQALLLQEKMALQLKLLATAGLGPPSSPPSYRHLVSENTDTGVMWKEVLNAVQEVSQLASSLYASGTNLSRSVSSVGEHQSEAYVSPTLPKRAETFGGFDNAQPGPGPPLKLLNKKLQPAFSAASATSTNSTESCDRVSLNDKLPWRNAMLATVPPGLLNANTSNNSSNSTDDPQAASSGPPDLPALLTLGREQQVAAVQLSHYVYRLLCIISQQMTSIDSLQAQLLAYKSVGVGGSDKSGYRHNQQLEELRNLQDKFSGEKAAWQQMRDNEQRELEEKRQELMRLQEQIRAEENDIKQQRDQLYRKMEVLSNRGLLISPNVVLPVVPPHDETNLNLESDGQNINNNGNTPTMDTSPPGNTGNDTNRRKPDLNKWANKSMSNKSTLPLNLISATNQVKVSQSLPIKQQLPLKLASKLSSNSSSTQLSSATSHTSATASSGPQQMLPLKLSQEEKSRRSSSSGGYQRLSSGSFSPPSDIPITPSHSRAGSSPAIMPDSTSIQQVSNQITNIPPTSSGAKAARTHTYPKLPERFRVRSPEQPQAPPPPAPEEDVIFF
ncbi:rho guanine nucleotide exchange factor 18 isoform X3 [Chrysoperla carnea]|nr:rho guanine nucleotide exchange factor 18 isoform X3 [Chrysoperla carnea]